MSIFATVGGYGEFKGQGEFLGGKFEKSVTPQQARIREIWEELIQRLRLEIWLRPSNTIIRCFTF